MASCQPPKGSRLPIQGSPEPIAALNRVRIVEYAHPWAEREPLVDIRTYCPNVFISDRICPFLRLHAANMLNRAVDTLGDDRRFRIGTALRTLAMQKGGWDKYFSRMRDEHPTWPLSALRRATNKYFAPYDQKAPPGHCSGGAVDVILVDADNQPVDVTAPTEGWEAAYTWSDRVAPEPRANRMRMVEAMLAAGFSNCRDEYWHYSWGDSAWAVRVGETECPYGWTHPPVCLETDFPEATAGNSVIETQRDFDGRAIRATGHSALPECLPADPVDMQAWRIGLYWARDVPISIVLSWPSLPLSAMIYAGPSLEELKPLSIVRRDGDSIEISIVPAHDRTILSNAPPVAKS